MCTIHKLQPTDTIKQGYMGYTGSNKNTFNNNWYKNRESQFIKSSATIRKEILIDLEGFILKLKELNIKPILFTTPTYTEFNKVLDNRILNKNKHDIDKICAKYKIEYWNYMNDSEFKKKDFYNCDHLNKKGAIKFSLILSKRLNTYTKKQKIVQR